MIETAAGSQAKVDRHASATAKPGTHLPTAPNGTVLVFDAAQNLWVPQALPGGGAAASKADPLGFGMPWTVDPRLTSAQAQVGAANRGWWYRVSGGKQGVTKIALSVVTSSGNICAAIYANTGTGRAAAPGARLATTGSIACPAAGYAELTLDASVDVAQGDHWFYFSADNITATFEAAASGAPATTVGLRGYAEAAFPAPASAPALQVGNRYLSLIGV